MKKLFILFPILLLAATTGQALAQSTLIDLSRDYLGSTAQILCSFDKNPEYTVNTNEKRIDLLLKNTMQLKGIVFPEGDNKIVKILALSKKDNTTLSLFFRYPPQKVKAIPGLEGNKLTLEILLGNEFSSNRPAMANKIQPEAVNHKKGKDPTNPVNISPYPGNWKKFFQEYESDSSIQLPVQFSLPTFPAITLLPADKDEDRSLLPPEITEGAKNGRWTDLLPLITELLTHEKNSERATKLGITSAEILIHAGHYQEAYKLLFELVTQNGDKPSGLLANYLLLRLQAEYADLYLADLELKNLDATIDTSNPLKPWLQLTRIETALASGQFDVMGNLLGRDNIAFPAGAIPLKSLRRADYWMSTGELIKAHAAYQLLDKSSTLQEDNSSLNRYCEVLYHHKQYDQAKECYEKLAAHPAPSTTAHLDMISFHKAMARLRTAKDKIKTIINEFAQIESIYPTTEAGLRAALKQYDLKLLSLKHWEKPALGYYEEFAAKTDNRLLHDEATFKMAVLNHMLDQDEKSAEILMRLLRDSHTSDLHDTAQALLVEIVPGLLKKYISESKPIEALVLAKQNHFLFRRNWIDISLLADMAEAYRQLGFFNESLKLYTYLLDVSSTEDSAIYYLPLIKLAFEQGEYEAVEEYADRYTQTYPKGADLEKILFVRLQNLMTRNKYTEALTLLSSHNFKDPQFTQIEASLHFHLNEYAKTLNLLEKMLPGNDNEQERLFMRAESAFQLGDFKLAEAAFTPLQDNSLYKDQALFRLAEIARHNNQNELALKLFKRVADTGENPLWKKLAKNETELTALETKK